jgi:2',3'-cyclic-nucleotide 2'-phosphodiesterase (5'-nucleotidase family)
MREAVAALLILTVACGTGTRSGTPPSPNVEPAVPSELGSAVLATPTRYTVIADSIEDDPTMEALVEPFRARMGDRINEVLGEASGPFTKAWPEGSLGNFAADAILWGARRTVGQDVEIAVANNGGLRVPLAEGPITAGTIFELMPFDNTISVLTLSGRQLQETADYIASRGGEPVAGWSFRMEETENGRVARDVLVGGEPLESERVYRLATSDYLANGGDEFAVFQKATAQLDLPLLVRDVFMEYVRHLKIIRPSLEGRITEAGRP